MAMAEIDSFLLKFKTLWKSGRDATLTVETHAGKAYILLRLGLGKAPKLHPIFPFPSPGKNRNGPARQRRRAKRELTRLNAVEAWQVAGAVVEAVQAGEEVGKEAGQEAGNAVVQASEKHVVAENIAETVRSLVTDELCSDSIYSEPNQNVEKEKVEEDEFSEKLWKFVRQIQESEN